MTALLFLLEGLVLLILGADLERNFALLGGGARMALLAAAACAGLAPALPPLRRRLPVPSRAPLAWLAAAAALAAAIGAVAETRAGRIAATWDEGARERLETRAARLESDFTRFLQDLALPLTSLAVPVADQRAAFARLEEGTRGAPLSPERRGFSIYLKDGTLLAWTGNSTPPPPRLLEDADPGLAYGVGGREAAPRLFAVLTGADGTRRVAEYLLQPAGAPEGRAGGLALDVLPHWKELEPAHVHLRDPHGGAEDLARYFARTGDRHWGQVGTDGLLSLSIPLRSAAGAPLAIASLTDVGSPQAAGAARRAGRRAAALVLALGLLFALVPRAVRARPAASLALGSLAVWSARLSLWLVADTSDLPGAAIFDISLYGSSALWGLLRSPADLFLTAVAVLVQAWLLGSHLHSHPVPDSDGRRGRQRFAGFAALAAAALLGGALLHDLLDRVVLDARFDLARIGGSPPHLPRLLVQAALFFTVAAWGLLLRGLYRFARRRRRAGPPAAEGAGSAWGWSRLRAPAAARAALGLALITAIYVPFLQHAYDRLIRNYFEHDLLPRVLHQAERRRQILRDSLQHAGEPEFAAAARFAEETGDDPADHADEIAYGLWSTTPMAHRGLASSLQVFDARGERLGRFSLNYAPALDVRFERAAEAAGTGLIALPPPARAVVRTPVVYGSRWIQVARRTPLLVTMAVVDDWDNLPLLGSESVYLEMFRSPAPSRTNPELMRGEPMVAAFGAQLERIDGAGEAIPAPPPAALAAVEAGRLVWSDGEIGGQPARILYARGTRALFALAHPRSSRAGQVASFLRLLLLNAALALAVLAAARLVRAAGGTPLAWPRTTYAGRLVAVLLITGLGPLLALSFFVTRFAQREFERDLLGAGLTSLDTARRVVEDYLDVSGPGPEPALDDDVVFWLSRVVRQDVNVYRGADLLATSTRALYSSGLLNRRLAGGAYRALTLEREPYRLAESRVGGAGWLTLSAAMRIDRDGTPGVISIPLAAQRRAVQRRADEVEDAILIVTFAASLLLAAAGHVMARRVALPVQHLARAARRVAEGDLDVRVEARGDGETGVLVETFNRMAASLRAQREDLRRRRDYIEKILRSATTGVVSIDAAGCIATINPAAQSLLRTGDSAPAPGDRLLDHLASDPAFEPLHRALRRALERPADREATVVIARPGEERRLRAVFLPFAAEEGTGEPGRIVILEDVTEVVRAGRLAAFAEMARRVAHEIKNPLTPIQLSVEHVRRLRRAGDPRFDVVLEECLANIQKQVEVLRQIAHEFSAYARLPRVRPEPTAVADLLDDALKPYETAAPPGVRLSRLLAPGLPPVLVDRAVAARALVNLIENALQAMPGGGSITVAAATDGGGDPGRVRIEVRDTGTGIDPEILPRLFEPYFSTRSGGTGLGLAVARKAVEEQGGTLDLKSRPGAGTVAILTLPAAPAPVPGGAA